MKKQDNTLFKIGEVTKIMGITRKTLLVLENAKLLTPAVRDEESGYRYYSADNITQIRAIRSLQMLGLTLKEVKEYYYNTESIDVHLQRLTELRATIDRNIQMLQVRSTKPGDLTIHETILPQQTCFCRRYLCRNISDAANKLRNTYIDAIRTGETDMLNRMFTMQMSPTTDKSDIMCCIPIKSSYKGHERMEFEETSALCIYYRGSYEKKATAMRVLTEYAKENGIEASGYLRSVYLEGPPNRGTNTDNYITQIALPIKK